MAAKGGTSASGVTQCVYVNPRTGHRCVRRPFNPQTNLCRFHYEVVNEDRDASRGQGPQDGPVPSKIDLTKAALTNDVRRKGKSASSWILNEQAKNALIKLGNPMLDPVSDPKVVLMGMVNSAWRQVQVWEAMLASTPEEDFALIGQPPIPGSMASSKGARIEALQRMLLESTKVAARTSKLAIDAGIEERLVKLAEEQANLIADTVRSGILIALAAVAKEFGLGDAFKARANDIALSTAAGHLRVLAAGGPEIVEGIAHVVTPGNTPGSRTYQRRKARLAAAEGKAAEGKTVA